MKKLLIRLIYVLFMPLIAVIIMGQQDYSTGEKIGFFPAMKIMWKQCWSDEE